MDFQPRQIVLVDTNVILEAHRTACWVPLATYFALHTVAKVVEETQTGYQNRDPEHWIDESVLRDKLAHVEPVSETQRVTFNMTHDHPALDAGERDLLIYAETMASPARAHPQPPYAARSRQARDLLGAGDRAGQSHVLQGPRLPALEWQRLDQRPGQRGHCPRHVRRQGRRHRGPRWNVGKRIRDIEEAPDGSLWMLEDAEGGGLFHLTPK